MKVAFLGSPQAAVPALSALLQAGHEVPLVISRADRRRGRGGARGPTPVKEFALEHGLEVGTDPDLAVSSGAQLGVVVAFGRILRPPLLGAMPLINLHFSLLPRWRGAAPVERAILAGDATTGVCIMEVEAGLDTGAVYARAETPIGETETAAELTRRLSHLGAEELVAALAGGLPPAVPQSGEVVTAAKITVEDRHLDWEQPAHQLSRVVRVGRAWTTFRGKRLLVHEAYPFDEPASTSAPPGALEGASVAAGGGSVLELVSVQPSGKEPQSAFDWLRGARPLPHERLGA